MANKKEEAKYDMKLIVLVAAVFLLIGAGVVYFQQGQPPATTPLPAGANASSAAVKTLLGAFEKGEALNDYSLEYRTDDNGQKNTYKLKKNDNGSWVQVDGNFGDMQGYFDANTSNDVVCLTYSNETVCAKTLNQTGANEIAASLKILLPDKKTYSAQKEQMTKLIAAGAIVVNPNTTDEQVGLFDTVRVSYVLDYRGLTVKQLQAIGLSPNDPSLTNVVDQKVSFWIDKKTGFAVKSSATYTENLVPKKYDMTYSLVDLNRGSMPAVPEKLSGTDSLVVFYSQAERDYGQRATCNNMQPNERDLCFKNAAVGSKKWDFCKQIKNQTVYEECSLIVAQSTNNYWLCANLTIMADDCYISVAGETGDFSLCKKLKNSSLSDACTASAKDGKTKMDAKDEAYRRLVIARNCNASSDCRLEGNFKQYCASKNATGPFRNETDAVLKCYKYAPCGCSDGYCAFSKNETYYQCVNDIENNQLEQFLTEISANATKNSSTAASQSK